MKQCRMGRRRIDGVTEHDIPGTLYDGLRNHKREDRRKSGLEKSEPEKGKEQIEDEERGILRKTRLKD